MKRKRVYGNFKYINMNTNFEKSSKSSEFDLDPCAPMAPLWNTAKVMFNKDDDGLSRGWFGRVWLNPPYSRPLIEEFIKKMAEHNNGIALLYNRCDSKMFQDIIFAKAKAMLFMKHRIRFYKPDGTVGGSPGRGSILIAFGDNNVDVLRNCGIEGKFVRL